MSCLNQPLLPFVKPVRAAEKPGAAIEIEHESVGCAGYFGFLAGIGALVMLVFPVKGNLLIAAFLYIIYWAEVCMSKCMKYLCNVMSEKDFLAYVEKMQNGSPEIDFSIQNWHMETEIYYVTVKDANGNTRRERRTRQKRVNTHFASMSYRIAGHTDETMSPSQAIAMFHLLNQSGDVGSPEDLEKSGANFIVNDTEKALIMTCHFPIDFRPRDSHTMRHYPSTKSDFYRQNTMDDHQDKSETHTVNGHIEFAIVVISTESDDSTSLPWWATPCYFMLASLFFCGMCFRNKLYATTQKLQWDITKHFSAMDASQWVGDPIDSLKHSPHPVVAKVHELGKNIKIRHQGRREESGVASGNANAGGGHNYSGQSLTFTMDPPRYWQNQDLSTGFDDKVPVPEATKVQIQKLLDDTFKRKSTRDRNDKLPTRLVLQSAHRIEDANMWRRYRSKQMEMAQKRGKGFTLLPTMPGSGEAKTTKALSQNFRSRLNPGINEMYLFHGTKPTAVMGIREDGWMLSKAGSNVGTMFGKGAYFAENSSKCDEYAQCDDSGLFEGIYAALIGRVTMGEMFYITESNIPAIDKAMSSGEYDSVLGDREAPVNTYREFVAFDEAMIYPEFVVLYRREY